MKRIALLSIMMLIALCSQAQIYSSEACFYIKAGEAPRADDYDCNSSWIVVTFRGNKASWHGGSKNYHLYFIREYLKLNQNYYEERNDGWEFTFDSSLSTSSEYVYTRYEAGWTSDIWPFQRYPAKYEKFVFNKDNSTLTRYYKKEGDSDYEAYYYVRVPKSEVLPVSNGFIE
ncbi:MAG: hypothetical protein ACI353_01000 [Alloprevotella sp.]